MYSSHHKSCHLFYVIMKLMMGSVSSSVKYVKIMIKLHSIYIIWVKMHASLQSNMICVHSNVYYMFGLSYFY